MTTRERLERKLEKRREWAEGASAEAAREFERAHNAVKDIPLGQPNINGCLTGAINRSNTAMRHSCEASERADYHAEKARGLERALKTNIYSDDPDALEAIAEKIARLEELQDNVKIVNAICRKKKLTDAEKIAEIELRTGWRKLERVEYWVIEQVVKDGGFPPWVLSNNGANMRRLQQRAEDIKARAERSAKAEQASGGVLIERHNGWCHITFAEKPEREILTALKDAGFWWKGGMWRGDENKIPECIKELIEANEI